MQQTDPEINRLFPVFLKLENLRVLIVGGGKIGLEKITAVLNNSPATAVVLVAKSIRPEIRTLRDSHPGLVLLEREYRTSDLDEADLVIAATGNRALAERIKRESRYRRLLANVADTPDLCDFYLGSIVRKGDLKIAISTNGKSPTLAKRLKEVLNEAFPDETQDVIRNLNAIRNSMRVDFEEKIKTLNEITAVLVEGQTTSGEKEKETELIG